MCKFKYFDHQYIVTYKNVEYIFAHSKEAWAFIFVLRKDFVK